MVIWVEGEDEPAHNFVSSSKEAIETIIKSGAERYPELKISIKKIREQRSSEGESEDEGDEF